MTPEAFSDAAHLVDSGFKKVEVSPRIVGDIAKSLSNYIVGQDEAVNAVARSILRAKAQSRKSKPTTCNIHVFGKNWCW